MNDYQPSQPVAAVILAAGKGTRMKSDLPKVLHPIAGRPMIRHLLATVEALSPARIVVVTGREGEAVAQAVAPHATALQDPPLGTGHAVMAALPALEGFNRGTVLTLAGGDPFVSEATLRAMLAKREAGAAVVVVGFRPADPARYGRLVTDAAGGLDRIVEFADASPEERAINLCNGGYMAIDAALLKGMLGDLGNGNVKGEYYLTDIIAAARARGQSCAVVECPEAEVMGIDTRMDLAVAEKIAQQALRRRAMENGATLTDPDSVHLCWDTKLGRDVTIGPFCVFGPGVEVADKVEIRAFSHLEGATVDSGAVVGPYARLRPGAVIGPDAHVGNFVEVKNASLGKGAKANHLAYLGDASVGAGTNIGAGTITCNYDGFAKHHTEIGAGVFIGSNSALVAPVSVGDGAMVAAGSTITKDVPADALSVARGKQTDLEGAAKRFRDKRKK
ncbi:MAG: bifunctional UDP-N-acetylglucosamine diphosphorylase/glucosamine-1-phosphate N-acetyltransferase GlmU [Oceanibaculum nanhaiense]|uniref:bifunctional UDP-N-acetylglucosamine diphosphorylase/glucosamine-1-phosphate N-acetyltransferase GlmU n=1 Tax=Oceanibaculum nanhaiense TaxID=1909734 RepID=UPI0025A3537E|nr:bifunctional UDP-N-acetylglucosamine diphosphorylase/glucosamine-1-phosphate N-acetyltransferase GlmU [Oceanibaculum nanhaiense]MDM7946090.1 bifunctional UDP-N-acetylglucosamine diphosphorylase/glucosamine-1-phosphate N-acetyltransferase GlmU [Oceanibaculum nanhaiense]